MLESILMVTKIIFTCPVCGSHELMQIQQAVHRVRIDLARNKDGGWLSVSMGEGQEIKGHTLGFRCARCRYPDVPNHEDSDGFYWQTLDHVAAAGVLNDFAAPLTVKCIICQPDGRIRYITQVPPHGGSLSVAERQAILTAHGAPRGSVLLLESEKYS